MGVVAIGIHQSHHLNPSRAEGVGDVLTGVLRPADHIDFFAAQFIDHLLNAGASGSDAGAYWINLALDAVDSHFGAGSHGAAGGIGFASHGHNSYRAFLNLRNFVFKQIHNQASIGSAHEQLRPSPGHFAHFFEEHLEGGIGTVVVVGKLVPTGQFCFYLRPAQARAHGHDHALALKADHPSSQHGILKIGKFLLNHPALLIPQLLGQHLLGGGSCHAAEIILFGSDIQYNSVTNLSVFGYLTHLLDGNLMIFAFYFFDNDLGGQHTVALFFEIKANVKI